VPGRFLKSRSGRFLRSDEGQLEVAVRQKGNEPLGPVATQVEGLVKANVLEITGRQDGEQAVSSPQVEARHFQDLPPKWDRVADSQGTKVEVTVRKEEAIPARRSQGPAFAQGVTEVIEVEKFLAGHLNGSYIVGQGELPSSIGPIDACSADR